MDERIFFGKPKPSETEPSQEHFPTEGELHTDVLERRYGKMHTEILRHDDVSGFERRKGYVREAKLLDEKGISRTHAVTFLTPEYWSEDLATIDRELREGGSIGKVFREHGYEVRKNVLDVYIGDIPERLRKDFQEPDTHAKVRLSEFYAKKHGEPARMYGKVIEIYSPDFKDPKKGVNDRDRQQINPTTAAMISQGIPMEEIWKRLGREGETGLWDGWVNDYAIAREESGEEISLLREEMRKYIMHE